MNEPKRSFADEALGNGRFRISDGARTWHVVVDRAGSARWITIEGIGTLRIERSDAGRRRRRESGAGELAAPMPGRIVKVAVAVGESVIPGQDLVVLEAMKMEIKIAAPSAGRVKAVHVAPGDPCEAGQALVELET